MSLCYSFIASHYQYQNVQQESKNRIRIIYSMNVAIDTEWCKQLKPVNHSDLQYRLNTGKKFAF